MHHWMRSRTSHFVTSSHLSERIQNFTSHFLPLKTLETLWSILTHPLSLWNSCTGRPASSLNLSSHYSASIDWLSEGSRSLLLAHTICLTFSSSNSLNSTHGTNDPVLLWSPHSIHQLHLFGTQLSCTSLLPLSIRIPSYWTSNAPYRAIQPRCKWE